MDIQKLYSLVRQAIKEYNMIKKGDKIAIGISGGKDSLSLLYALAGLRKFYPENFEIEAITIDLGFDKFSTKKISDLCQTLQVPYHVVETSIGEISKDEGCSLCAKLRRGALFDKAVSLGCNKIAYAHNMDDMVETMLLSLIYEGRFSTFYPVTYFEDTKISVIRPFIFVTQAEATGFKNKYNLPVETNPCPYDKTSERSYVRALLSDINKHAPNVKKRMMTAILNGNIFPPNTN